MTVFPVVFSSIVFIAYYGMGQGLTDFNLKVISSNLNYFIVKRLKKISVTIAWVPSKGVGVAYLGILTFYS